MEQGRALEILKALGSGVDPYSGEAFPLESAYQKADTVRALHEAIRALERQGRRTEGRGPQFANAGKPWTEEEDRKLLAGFAAGRSLQELSAGHERTVWSIQARLVKHGKISLPAGQGAVLGGRTGK